MTSNARHSSAVWCFQGAAGRLAACAVILLAALPAVQVQAQLPGNVYVQTGKIYYVSLSPSRGQAVHNRERSAEVP